jgi:hypothetical protein
MGALLVSGGVVSAPSRGAASASNVSIGVQLDNGSSNESGNDQSCSGLDAYDAWATGQSPAEFGSCGWTTSDGANGGVTGLAGGRKAGQWTGFTGSAGTQGRVSLIVSMQPTCLVPLATLSVATGKSQISTLNVTSPPGTTAAIGLNDLIEVASGTKAQIFEASSAVGSGSMSISIDSATPNFNFPSGSTVADVATMVGSEYVSTGDTTPFATIDSTHGLNQCVEAGNGSTVNLTNADLTDIAANLASDVYNWCDPNKATCTSSNYCTYSAELVSQENQPCNWAPYYIATADALMGSGDGNAYIRLGDEAEGNWYADQYGPDPADWATYYGKIVKTMDLEQSLYNKANMTNYQFKFVWVMGLCASTAPTVGGNPVPPSEAWPTSSNGTPSVIGLDFDDQVSGQCGATANNPYQEWNVEQTETNGIDYWVNFAQGKGLPLALTQWEPQDDNPYFIDQVYQTLINTGDVLFSDYFDVGASRLSSPNTTLTASAGPGQVSTLDVAATTFAVDNNDPIEVVSDGQTQTFTADITTDNGILPAGAMSIPIDTTNVPTSFPSESVAVDPNVPSLLPNSSACYRYLYFYPDFENTTEQSTCETALNTTTLKGALSNDSQITSLAVVKTTFVINNGDTIQVTSPEGTYTESFTAYLPNGPLPAGSGTITIAPANEPVTVQGTYPTGSTVTDETNLNS